MTIYGQREGSGRLEASGCDNKGAGIGGSQSGNCGCVTINDGIVTATGNDGGGAVDGEKK